jgi:glyoxylase-like metal-dependent hydrolase (beta-lactamase superfamily II)
MRISHILETHIHADHISGARLLAERSGAPVYLGPGAEAAFHHIPLMDGQELQVGNRRIRVLHTPGHTPEHVCLLGDDWYLFTGDTLFAGDVGRVDLASDGLPAELIEARSRQLYGSLQRLLALPDWIEVYPGHYAGSVCGRGMDGKASSTIGRERRTNRALQLPLDEFTRYQLEDLPPLPPDFQTIKMHNLGRA